MGLGTQNSANSSRNVKHKIGISQHNIQGKQRAFMKQKIYWSRNCLTKFLKKL